MGLKLITPPAVDALTLTEAKAHLRVTDSDHDTEIAAFTKSATGHAEVFLGRALIDQTWDLYLDSFPTGAIPMTGFGSGTEIKIPKPPLISVVGVFYNDAGGIEQTVDPGDYYVDSVSEPGWVVPQGGASWPTTLNAINAVRIRFRAGYLDNNSPPGNAVPEDIKAAVKLMLGTLYEKRENVTAESANLLPWSAEQLLRQHRIVLSMA